MNNSSIEALRRPISGGASDALSGGTPPYRALSASGSGVVYEMEVVSEEIETK